jgi:hypothetical protein
MSPIIIEHHRTATATCRGCDTSWHAGDAVSVLAVLTQAAEHAIEYGHTVAEHVTDDATVRPEGGHGG